MNGNEFVEMICTGLGIDSLFVHRIEIVGRVDENVKILIHRYQGNKSILKTMLITDENLSHICLDIAVQAEPRGE